MAHRWPLSVKMAGPNTIKLFQFNQKFCQTIGIQPPQATQNRFEFNTINVIFIICMAQFAMALTAFTLYDANSMDAYGATFVALVCVIEGFGLYSLTIRKMEDILRFTEHCEQFIEKSKCINHLKSISLYWMQKCLLNLRLQQERIDRLRISGWMRKSNN